MARLFNFLGRSPDQRFTRDAASVPDFSADAITSRFRLPEQSWDFGNAYRMVPEIFFAIRLNQDGIAPTPLRFFTTNRDGSKNYLDPNQGTPETNVAALFATANSEETGRDLIANIVGSQDLFGPAYLWKEYGAAGRLRGLWAINPLMIEIEKGPGRSIAAYRMGPKKERVDPKLILRFGGFDPLMSFDVTSPLAPLIQQYQALYDAWRLINRMFQNGGILPGFLGTEMGLDDGMRKRIQRQVEKMVHALRTKWRWPVLPKGLTYTRAALNIQEMDLDKLDEMLIRKVLRAYRIPSTYAAMNERGGMNSDTEASARKRFHELVREPRCNAIAAVINERLLKSGEFGAGVRCEFDFSALPCVQEDRLNEATKLVTLTGRPIMTADEAREKLGLEAIGGTAAELVMPITLMTDTERTADAQLAQEQAQNEPSAASAPGRAQVRRAIGSHSRDRRGHLRMSAARALRRHASRMRSGFVRVFDRQQVRVTAKLTSQLEGRMNGQREAALRAVDVNDLLRDDEGDTAIIQAIVRRIIAVQGEQASSELAAQLGVELAFELGGESIAGWIRRHAADAVTQTTETTRARLRDTIAEGLGKRESLGELVARVNEVFDGRRSAASLRSIAITECLTADTPIDGANVLGAYRRWYQGEMVEVVTKSGHKLTGTPNHPMLTTRGWVALGELAESDYLINHGRRIEPASRSGNEDVQEPPTTIGEVFDSLAAVRVAQRVRGGKPDFHGDGTDGDVDVLRADGELRLGRFAAIGEGVCNLSFAPADARRVLAACDRATLAARRAIQQGDCVCAAPHGSTMAHDHSSDGGGCNSELRTERLRAFTGGIAGHDCVDRQMQVSRVPLASEAVPGCVRHGSENAVLLCEPENHSAVAADRLRNIGGAQSARIEADGIASLVRFQWCGHVFNLTTVDGYFVASGLYTKNCTPAYNWATEESWRQSGEVEAKEYLTAHDDHVRETHREADGQVVPLDGLFEVGGLTTDVPGNTGDPQEDINCRCTMVAVLRQRSRVEIPGPIKDRMKSLGTLEEWLHA